MPPRPRSLALALFAGLALAPATADGKERPKAPADPAAAAVAQCRSSDLDRERRCYEDALAARLAKDGAAGALELLGRLAALDEDVRREGHMHAHRIGIMALRSPDEVGAVFAACTPAWESGCYHGVIQSYFLALQRQSGGLTTESVDALCAGPRDSPRNAALHFQCIHGLGHGLAVFHGHNLPRALGSCDLLSRGTERELCYAGAFMETLVNATHPHHAVARPSGSTGDKDEAAKAGKGKAAKGAKDESAKGGHSEHGHGHDGHAAGTAKPSPHFAALDPADLHYPCSALDSKYLIACYTMQTSAMLHHTGYDFGRAATECGRAPEKARTTCFLSLGRDVSSRARLDSAEGVRLCGLAETAYRPTCHRGVVETLVNIDGNPAAGIPYCRAVTEADSKRACYVAVGQQALVHPDGPARQERACRAAETGFVELCLGRPIEEKAPAES